MAVDQLGWFVALEQLVLNVIGPRLMSQGLGLSPLVSLFVVLIGAQVAGAWGAILAVPVAAIVKNTIAHFRCRWSRSAHQAMRVTSHTRAAGRPHRSQLTVGRLHRTWRIAQDFVRIVE